MTDQWDEAHKSFSSSYKKIFGHGDDENEPSLVHDPKGRSLDEIFGERSGMLSRFFARTLGLKLSATEEAVRQIDALYKSVVDLSSMTFESYRALHFEDKKALLKKLRAIRETATLFEKKASLPNLSPQDPKQAQKNSDALITKIKTYDEIDRYLKILEGINIWNVLITEDHHNHPIIEDYLATFKTFVKSKCQNPTMLNKVEIKKLHELFAESGLFPHIMEKATTHEEAAQELKKYQQAFLKLPHSYWGDLSIPPEGVQNLQMQVAKELLE